MQATALQCPGQARGKGSLEIYIVLCLSCPVFTHGTYALLLYLAALDSLMSILRNSAGCSSNTSSLLARSQSYRPLPFPLSSTRSSPPCSSLTTKPLLVHVRATRRVFVSLSRNTLLIKPIPPSLVPSKRPHTSPTMAVTTTMQTQTRAHAGHSHNHDNTYLTSTNKADAGVRITRIGLFVNLGMAIGKALGGYYFHSQGTFGTRSSNVYNIGTD